MKILSYLIIFIVFLVGCAKGEVVSSTSQMGNDQSIADSVDLCWPFSRSNTVTDFPLSSPFGPRLKASSNFAYDFHRGIDIPRPNRTNLYAVQGGKIFRSRVLNNDLYISLRVNHTAAMAAQTGYSYFYATYRHLNTSFVVENQTVNKGDIIALSGASDAGYPHLHFDISQGGSWETNNTHPLYYLHYLNTDVPSISKIIENSPYLEISTKKVSFRVTVSSTELDLIEVSVIGTINNAAVSGVLNFAQINKITYNKALLDNPYQVLANEVSVTISPHSHNAQSVTCVVDFSFDFSSVVGAAVSTYILVIKAKDVQGGFTNKAISL